MYVLTFCVWILFRTIAVILFQILFFSANRQSINIVKPKNTHICRSINTAFRSWTYIQHSFQAMACE